MQNKTQALKSLNIPRATFYHHSKKDSDDEQTRARIESVLADNPSYGSRRIAQHLKANRKQISRVMKKYGIRPLRAKRAPKYRSFKGSDPSPNLLVSLVPLFKNHVWVTDFTYLWWQGRFVYLCTVMDLYTREIVGCSIKTNHSALLVSEALLNAIHARGMPHIIHSDQGSEYRSKLFRSLLNNCNILQSMSKKASPWQNGYQESFFGNFKVDVGDISRFKTFGELVSELYRSIYYYNTNRIHSAFGCSPRQFAERDSMNYTAH